MSPGRTITYLWKLKAEALAAKECTTEALVLLYEAINNAEETGERFLLWRLHVSRARLYRAVRQLEEAEKEGLTARALIDELADSVPDKTLQKNFRDRAYRSLQVTPERSTISSRY
jgi:hypothetical protein